METKKIHPILQSTCYRCHFCETFYLHLCQSDCIENIKTSVLYVDSKPTMLTLDYTVDPSLASADFKEEGEKEPAQKKAKAEAAETTRYIQFVVPSGSFDVVPVLCYESRKHSICPPISGSACQSILCRVYLTLSLPKTNLTKPRKLLNPKHPMKSKGVTT